MLRTLLHLPCLLEFPCPGTLRASSTGQPLPGRKGRQVLSTLAAVLAALGYSLPAWGQDTSATPNATEASDTLGHVARQISREDAPLVFLDCRRCDDAHIR
ncbi:MAG: hypothetical protein ACQET1_10760, partial [Gemmatimonadota bacterium]